MIDTFVLGRERRQRMVKITRWFVRANQQALHVLPLSEKNNRERERQTPINWSEIEEEFIEDIVCYICVGKFVRRGYCEEICSGDGEK